MELGTCEVCQPRRVRSYLGFNLNLPNSRPSPFPFELTPRFDGIDDIVNLHGGIAQ